MTTGELTPAQAAAHHVAEALVALGRLRQAWPWLADMIVPSAAQPPPGRYLTEQQRALIARQIHRDRRALLDAARRGHYVAGGHADAARIGPVSARARIAASVKTLCERVHAHLNRGETLVWPFGNPRMRQPYLGCDACGGLGCILAPLAELTGEQVAALAASLPGWEPSAAAVEEVLCPECAGRGFVSAQRACSACHRFTSCLCDHDDVYIAWGLSILPGDLDDVTDPAVAAHAARVLVHADTLARRAAQSGEDNRVNLAATCPACDRRELWADVGSPKHDEWAVRCLSPLCRCLGPPCRCRRPLRATGQAHLWPAREWDSPTGLSALLGVRIPDLLPDQPTT